MKTYYFIDFDNTISNRDVWDALVRTFAPNSWREVVRAYINGEITSREGNLRVAEFFPACQQPATALIHEIGVDPTFVQFVNWAEAQQLPIIILSDGYDYYIDLLLKDAGLAHLPYYSNRLKWTDSGIQVEFPYQHNDCVRDMAHCKCQHLQALCHYRRVYIGDGISDFCAAKKCEQIYAKHDLLEYCEKEEIDHVPFSDFATILKFEQSFINEAKKQQQVVRIAANQEFSNKE